MATVHNREHKDGYSIVISNKQYSDLLHLFGSSKLLKLLALFLLFSSTLPASAGESGGGINWSVTPYLWATETKYKLKADGTPIGEGKVTFDDLVDTSDASFQIVTEAGIKGGKWSAFVDVTYLETSDTYNGSILRVDSESENWLADAAVAWWPGGEDAGFSLFAGGRYTDLDDRFHFQTQENKQSLAVLENQRDFLDVLIGLRQRFTLGERWSLLTHGDYSWGDSDGIYQLQAIFRYGMGSNQQYGLMFGYRYKEARFKHGNLDEKNEYYGPLLGFNFRL